MYVWHKNKYILTNIFKRHEKVEELNLWFFSGLLEANTSYQLVVVTFKSQCFMLLKEARHDGAMPGWQRQENYQKFETTWSAKESSNPVKGTYWAHFKK